jgi:hypothetical protein
MQTATRAAIGFVTILSVVVSGASSALAAGITLNPSSGASGTTTSVSGNGFASTTTVRVYFNGSGGMLIGAEATDSSGNLPGFNVVIPSNVTGGNYQIFATDGSNTASATFTVNVGGANLTVSPTSGAAGSTVSLSGTGFGANEQVNLAVDGGVVTSVSSDGNGNFSTSLTLSSSLALGSHTISATGATSGHAAFATFQVTSTSQTVGCSGGDDDRPGNGFGDDNHCHTGPRGQQDRGDNDNQGDNHGRGHGHGHGEDD